MQISKEKFSRIKTHEEILDLLKEIEFLEKKIKNPQEKEISYNQYFTDQETKNDEIIQDFSKETEFVDVSKGEIEFSEIQTNPELSENLHEKYSFKKIPSTFNLTIDDDGNLIGLNVKTKINKNDKRKRTSTKTKDQEIEEETTVIGRITGLFSRIKLKTSSEEGSSRISNIFVKIKNIFSRS